jgi:hypothetical protein
MEETCSSETSVDFQLTRQHYIREDSTLRNDRCENPESYTTNMLRHFVQNILMVSAVLGRKWCYEMQQNVLRNRKLNAII